MFVVQFFKCASFTCLVLKTFRLTSNEFKLFFLFIQILTLFITLNVYKRICLHQFCKYILNYFSYCLNVYDKGDMQNKKVT